MEVIRLLNERILWGIPMMIFMLAAGVYLTIKTRGIIFRKLIFIIVSVIKGFFKKRDTKEGVSPFAAVSAALAATVGTGNIAGVAVAISLGGPGAVFWMWVSALFGMVIKYSEVTLAVRYRQRSESGELLGGPMYYIPKAFGGRGAAYLFCIFAAASSFGIGNAVQANSLAAGLYSSFGTERWISGIVLSAAVGMVLMGGARRIFAAAELLVPFMAIFYFVSAAAVLWVNSDKLLDSVMLIFRCAFSDAAPIGGFSGAAVMYAARIGVARGLFTNEAGLGSAPIAHAAADTDHPSRQGMCGAFEVFFDTIVMCSVTALVIISSGVWTENLGGDIAAQTAFSRAFDGGGRLVGVGLALFAFASVIAWYYYGERCVEYAFGKGKIPIYRVLYVSACFFGCVAESGAVWEISDTLNAFMALPNLAAVVALAPEAERLTMDFFKKRDTKKMSESEKYKRSKVYKKYLRQ